MTKKKLIKYLKALPDDAEVLVPSNETPGYVSPVWGVLFDDDTNEITIAGDDFNYQLEEEEDSNE